jgi:hypothetical protein
MEINWKELGLSYLLGYGLVLATILLNAYILAISLSGIDAVIYLIIVFAVPLSCYFLRNSCDMGTAFLISLIFGLTFLPIFALLNFAFVSLSVGPAVASLGFPWVDILILSTVFGVVTGLVVYGLPYLARKFMKKEDARTGKKKGKDK